MNATRPVDWNPSSQEVLDEQIAAYDAKRNRCPVAHSDYLWQSPIRWWPLCRVAIASSNVELPDVRLCMLIVRLRVQFTSMIRVGLKALFSTTPLGA